MSETVVYTVAGMTCAHCVAAVETATGALPGVEAASADLERGRLELRGSDIEDAAVRDAVAEEGYEAARA